ncbi:MAG: hypothetical protein AAGJ81_11270 [Verrucomicrobiota bacterium]
MKSDKTKRFFRKAVLVSLLIGFWTFPLSARTFTDKQGREMEAEIVEIYEDRDGVLMVDLQRSDRRQFTVQVSIFSQPDQQFIKDQWEQQKDAQTLLGEDDRIEINLKLNRTTDNNRFSAYYGSRWSDKTRVYRPEAVIANQELSQSFLGNTVRIVIIARDKGYSSRYLVASATNVPMDFPAKQSVSANGDVFALREEEYLSSASNYRYEYGYEKDDYVVIIFNREGEITHTRASSNKFLDNLDNVLRCKAGQVYSEGLEDKLNVRPNSYYLR